MEHNSIEGYFEFEERNAEEKKKYLIVIIYDVVDNRRRNRLAKYLKAFGFRVQRSSFECILDKKSYEKLISGIESYVAKEDALRIYRLSGSADVHTWGSIGKLIDEDVIIV